MGVRRRPESAVDRDHVDNTGDTPVLTDGPFVEAKEYLGGFWIIEAENDDAAIEWTKQASRALQSRVEVRCSAGAARRVTARAAPARLGQG